MKPLLLVGMAAWLCVALAVDSAALRGREEKVAAQVNGKPIYRKDVDAGLPEGAFARRAAALRTLRLNRLIDQSLLRQFLKAEKIAVPESEVAARMAQLRKYPPTMGCPCCRFPSLDQFLKVEAVTGPELREQTRNQIGLDRYLERLWEKTYPTPKSRTVLLRTERPRLTKEYVRAWHIFFNTFQPIDQSLPPSEAPTRAKANAEAAWQRLQSGESFAKVASAVSEDQISKGAGGSLGPVLRTIYGKDFDETLARLKPGEVSRPFASVFGYHIAKWEPMSDGDQMALLKSEFMTTKRGALLDSLRQRAKVVRYD